MKKLTIGLFAVVALAGSAFAGPVVSSGKESKEYKEYKVETPFTCFNDQELQLDVFGIYTNTQGGGAGDGFGGGVAINYYFQRYIGIGADVDLFNGGEGIWQTSGRILFRYPIDSICLAPYAFIGGGYQGGHGSVTAHAGVGLEYRIVPHKVGLFAEERYTYAGDDNDKWQTRLGVRVVF